MRGTFFQEGAGSFARLRGPASLGPDDGGTGDLRSGPCTTIRSWLVDRNSKGKPSHCNEAAIGAMFGCAWGIARSSAPGRPRALELEYGYSFVLIVALALPDKHRAMSTFRGSPQLVRPAVGSIGGLHLSGVRESHRVRVFLWTALAVCLVCGIAALLPGATANGNIDPPGLVTG